MVLHALATRLSSYFDVHLLGSASDLDAPADDVTPYALHLSSNQAYTPETLLDALPALVRRLRPDACLLLDEPWNCALQIAALRGVPHPPLILCYCAADEPGQLPLSVLPSLASAEYLVVFTQAASIFLQDAFRQADIVCPRLAVIAHGVDTTIFRPLPRREARLQVFGEDSALLDAFIVLNANRNQPFKRVDLTLEGFALFARNKPASVKLYLHMGSLPPLPGELSLTDRLGIRDRLLTPSMRAATHPHLADERLNLLYNCCDVGVNTADREGWGLVSFEHGATGAPQIVTGLATLTELWGNAALLLPTEPQPSPQLRDRLAPGARAEDVAAALEQLYTNHAARAQWGALALARARDPALRWDTLAEQWRSLIERALKRVPESPS